jgi:sortase A
MRNKFVGILAVLLLAIGFLILNYPTLSTLYNQLHQGTVLTTYDDTVQKMNEEKKKEYWQEAKAYNERLAGTTPRLTDAFSDKGNKEDSDYNQILNLEEDTGVMGSIEIPKISVYLPIYHGTSAEVLERGVGHMEGTSFPIGGRSTHAVLTGHRGLPSAELFTNLDQIEENDIFYLHILDKTLAYKVYNIETVEPSNVESLAIQQGRDLATLVTCTPYGINSHRLLIHAMRVPYKGETKDAKEALKENLWQWLLKQKTLLVSVALLLLLLIYFIIQRIKARREKKRREMERRARRQRQIREKGGK